MRSERLLQSTAGRWWPTFPKAASEHYVTEWPMTVFREQGLPGVNSAYAARVNRCAIVMVHMDKPACKQWKVEVRHSSLLKAVISSFRCLGDHEHAHIEGGTLAKQSAL